MQGQFVAASTKGELVCTTYRTPTKHSSYFAVASIAQIALYLKGYTEPSSQRSASRILRTYLTYNNDKPWFTTKFGELRQAKEDSHRNGNRVLYMWKGLKAITNYKTPSPNTEISEEDVRQVFRKNKRRKTPGPDGVTPACLKTFENQLAPIFSQIFNRSLELCEVPTCFKRSTIIPVPKKPKIIRLNDYRPVALMSVVMKSFEKLVLAYLKNITGPLLEPLQFAYRANSFVDDAVNMELHFILQHLDKTGDYVRILFVDFSSAFNTIIPALFQTKLNQLSVPSSICQWITSFLTHRQQLVKMVKFTSNSRTTSTVDDSTVIGLIKDGDESAYRQEVKELAVWCRHNNLELNMLKTVQLTVDFRRNPPALPPLTIMDSTVTSVETFRFLGTTITQNLKWDNHTDPIVKKAQQRLYFLRQLRKFNVPKELLKQFHSAIIVTQCGDSCGLMVRELY
ncbi:putative 149 kDa protein [Labeo rohita]|uniref:149 kDa protein n=1 Tax=Labeo rohita TaxID=84645 RepID=A0ABQ8MVW1_LABRO|nr:putative 149 kDa protein [Labeo rohita]